MSILSSVDLGNGLLHLVVDHDPTSVATDALLGSVITVASTGERYQKMSSGSNTDVKHLHDDAILRIWGNEAGALTGNQTVYAYLTGAPAITVTEDNAQLRMPKCHVHALSGRCSASTVASYTITVRKNGVATALTTGAVIAAPGHFRVTGDADFADGDLLSVELAMGGTGGQSATFRGLFIEVELL